MGRIKPTTTAWTAIILGEINDKCDNLAEMHSLMVEGINSLPNQLFHHSPCTISLKGKVVAYLDTQEFYDHTYGKTEFAPYW